MGSSGSRGTSWCSVIGFISGCARIGGTRQGIPFLIHHGNPIDEAVERNDIPRMTVTGHFRWLG